MSMFVQVLVLSYNIIMNRSMVQMQSVDGFSGQELISSKYSVTAGILPKLPMQSVFHDQGKRMLCRIL